MNLQAQLESSAQPAMTSNFHDGRLLAVECLESDEMVSFGVPIRRASAMLTATFFGEIKGRLQEATIHAGYNDAVWRLC